MTDIPKDLKVRANENLDNERQFLNMGLDFHINTEAETRTNVGEHATSIEYVKINIGGDYVLSFYDGQEETPKHTIVNPRSGDENRECKVSFDKGLTYTLIFNNKESSPKRCSVTVFYRKRPSEPIQPLS